MHNSLVKYISLIDFLSKLLGSNTEIVLQSAIKDHEGIVYIVNNHVSGRHIGDPLTDLSKKWIEEKIYKYQDYHVGYIGKTALNNKILSSTYFIKENNELVGLLCFNRDTSCYKTFFTSMLYSVNIPLDAIFDSHELVQQTNNSKEPVVIENLIGSIDIKIKNVLATLNIDINEKKLTSKEKKKLILEFNSQGIFMLKGSVNRVSELLNISIPSIYRYLNKN